MKRTLIVMVLALVGLAGADPRQPEAFIRIRREPVLEPRSICRERARIENRHETCPIGVVLVRTQYLFSGRLEDRFVVHVPPRGRRELGCSWWPGAMRRTGFEVLRTWYGPCPRPTRGPRDPDAGR